MGRIAIVVLNQFRFDFYVIHPVIALTPEVLEPTLGSKPIKFVPSGLSVRLAEVQCKDEKVAESDCVVSVQIELGVEVWVLPR